MLVQIISNTVDSKYLPASGYILSGRFCCLAPPLRLLAAQSLNNISENKNSHSLVAKLQNSVTKTSYKSANMEISRKVITRSFDGSFQHSQCSFTGVYLAIQPNKKNGTFLNVICEVILISSNNYHRNGLNELVGSWRADEGRRVGRIEVCCRWVIWLYTLFVQIFWASSVLRTRAMWWYFEGFGDSTARLFQIAWRRFIWAISIFRNRELQ